MKEASKSGNLLKGLSRKNPPGDSGVRLDKQAKSINSEATRSSVGRGHSIGGRTA